MWKEIRKTVSKRTIQKTTETTGDLIGNKIANKFTKVSKTLQKNNIEKLQMTIVNKYLKKDIYIQRKDKKLLMVRN